MKPNVVLPEAATMNHGRPNIQVTSPKTHEQCKQLVCVIAA
jgi:hypothetical protein